MKLSETNSIVCQRLDGRSGNLCAIRRSVRVSCNVRNAYHKMLPRSSATMTKKFGLLEIGAAAGDRMMVMSASIDV